MALPTSDRSIAVAVLIGAARYDGSYRPTADVEPENEMALEAVGEFFGRIILEVVVQLFGYFTAWVVVPVVTFGRVQVEPDRKRTENAPQRWRIHKASDGVRVMEAELAAFCGILFWVLIAILVWFIRN